MTDRPAYSIRRLNPDNAEAFSALRREVLVDYPVPMGLSLEEELARPMQGFRDQLGYPDPNRAFGAFVGTELVASGAMAWPSKLASSRHKANLWGVFTSPRYRRLGISHALLEELVRHGRANALRRINLTVYVPNEAATSLYASLGFVQTGIEPDAIRLDGNYYDGQTWSLALTASAEQA
jgi:ribosomal protein S18 acetylase RimI-like enzyme